MKTERGFASGLMTGLGLGALLLCMGTLFVLSWSMATRKKAREGWNLKPVVVAAVDIAAGDDLPFEVISQRSVPDQFVPATAVLPDAASKLIHARPLVPIQAGELLLWELFDVGGRGLELTRDVEAGAVLKAEDVKVVSFSKDGVSVTRVRADQKEVLGAKTSRALKAGAPLHFSDLIPPEAR